MNVLLRCLCLLVVLTTLLRGQEEPSFCDRMWAYPKLYANPNGSFLREFSLIGRYELQNYQVDSHEGNASGWENRRIRYGIRTQFAGNFQFSAQINADADQGLLYERLWSLILTWKPSDLFSVSLGKIRPRWSQEWAKSSYELLTFERSLLVDTARPFYLPGVAIDGKKGRWDWNVGIYGGDWDRELGSFNVGALYVASLRYDLTQQTGLDRANVRLDYMQDDGRRGKTGKGPWDTNIAFSADLKDGPLGLMTEVLMLTGNVDTTWGLTFMPSYDLTSKVQLVLHLHAARSDAAVIRDSRRYEREVGTLPQRGMGRHYEFAYLGLNYRIYGDRLKLMTGIEYAHMGGVRGTEVFSGWTGLSGIRFNF